MTAATFLIGVLARVGVFVATALAPLWYDEHFSRAVSALPWSQLWAATAGDVHPPAYYALLKLWRGAIWTPLPTRVEVRALSLALSLASLLLAWRVLRTLPLARGTRYAALLLYALLPGAIFYAIDARMYALLEFAVLGAVLGVLRRDVAATAGMLALAALTHNAGLLYAVMIAGVAVLWGRARLIAVAGGIAAVIWAVLWGAPFARQLGSVSASYWIREPSPGAVIYELFRSIFPGAMHANEYALMLIFAAVLAVGVWLAVQRRAWDLLLLAGGVPALIVAVAALGGPSVLLSRALMPAGLFVAVILALPARRAPLALAAMSVAFMLCWGGWAAAGRLDIAPPLRVADPPARIVAVNNVSVPLERWGVTPICIWHPTADGGLASGLSVATQAALGIEPCDPRPGDWVAWVRRVGSESARDIGIAPGDEMIFEQANVGLRAEIWISP